jgi:hypothetical protein
MCMQSLPSAETLQNHYERIHDPTITSANRDGDVLALRQELDDIRTSLKVSCTFVVDFDRLHYRFSIFV